MNLNKRSSIQTRSGQISWVFLSQLQQRVLKPSGTVSQLASVASGIHPRYAEHYIHKVRADVKDPLATWMIERQIPNEVDTYNPLNHVFSFPIKSPSGSITRNDMSALQQLELWMKYREHWCEHNPSITVYVGETNGLMSGLMFTKTLEMLGESRSYQGKTGHTPMFKHLTRKSLKMSIIRWLVRCQTYLSQSIGKPMI